MKKRIIDKHLKKKINSFLDSIEDVHVREMARRNIIVTGGFLKNETKPQIFPLTKRDLL